tara:strand:+ start:10849 stop:11349 length:501 start_codon:yes stop_codon:yes gene_type:complete
MVMTTSSAMKNYTDVHYTKPHVARAIVNHFSPSGKILEPFRGTGVFYNELPKGTLWCEIDDGINFYDFNEQVDWIVTNPTWSDLTDVMKHAFSIAQNTVLLIPLSKLYSSMPRMALEREIAGIREQLILGSGREIGFDLGFPMAAIHFERGYHGCYFNTHLGLTEK